jgi:molybdopterin-binding protein
VVATLKPEDAVVSLSPQVDPTWEKEAYNSLRGTIVDTIQMRSAVQVNVDVGFPIKCRVPAALYRQLDLDIGKEVYAQFRADSLNVSTNGN